QLESPPPDYTGSYVQLAFNSFTQSSADLPRALHDAPAASYSSGDHPIPKPNRSRPSERTSTVASLRASRTGLYQGIFNTLVPTAIRSVRAAAKVNVSTGSNTLLYCNGRVTSPTGYDARRFSVYTSRSSTQRLLKPSSSARRATRVIASGPATAPICGKANPIRTRPPYL